VAILPASITNNGRRQRSTSRRATQTGDRTSSQAEASVDVIVVGKPATALLIEALAYADALRLPSPADGVTVTPVIRRASGADDAASMARRSDHAVIVIERALASVGTQLRNRARIDTPILAAEALIEASCRDTRLVQGRRARHNGSRLHVTFRRLKLTNLMKRLVMPRNARTGARVTT